MRKITFCQEFAVFKFALTENLGDNDRNFSVKT